MEIGELVHAPPTSKAHTPSVDAVRAFVFLSGLRWLKEKQYDDRFRRLVPPRHHDLAERTAASDWIPIDVALEIYAALDDLALPLSEQVELGRQVAIANNGVIVNTIARLAGKMGLSPWTIFGKLHGVWLRNNRGGAVAVYRTKEREARLEFWAVPFARSDFFRTSLCGSIAIGIEPFAAGVRISEASEFRESDSFALRAAW